MTHDRYDPLGFGGSAGAAPRLRIAQPTLGAEEEAAVVGVLRSGILTNGPATRAFEQAMADRHRTTQAVAVANGTLALVAMYTALGIGPGAEVIVPSLTFISTATSVLHVGATPVFAEVRPDTLTLDPDDVARRLSVRTRAIVPVHYGGQAADLDRLGKVAADADALLLEDAAEAHGASFADRPVGGWGRAGMFSFTPTKNITTGEGGIITTDDDDLAHRLRLLRNHGMDAPYHHATLGHNWRITELQAAIGRCQLGRLDGIVSARQGRARALSELLAGVPHVHPPVEAPGRTHTYMLYTVRIEGPERRDRAAAALAARGIETRVYFPCAHLQPVFEGQGPTRLPISERLSTEILSLPIHAGVTDEALAEMAEVVADSVR